MARSTTSPCGPDRSFSTSDCWDLPMLAAPCSIRRGHCVGWSISSWARSPHHRDRGRESPARKGFRPQRSRQRPTLSAWSITCPPAHDHRTQWVSRSKVCAGRTSGPHLGLIHAGGHQLTTDDGRTVAAVPGDLKRRDVNSPSPRTKSSNGSCPNGVRPVASWAAPGVHARLSGWKRGRRCDSVTMSRLHDESPGCRTKDIEARVHPRSSRSGCSAACHNLLVTSSRSSSGSSHIEG